ncbi:MAG: lysine exporter LysO family protein [Bacteroidales bacterium]|nr:lysine exporter LysO family protein [Bacteroidales bacterium]
MIKLILMLLSGAVVGYILRKKFSKTFFLGKALMIIICLLLFIMGIDLGYNETLIPRLQIGDQSITLPSFAPRVKMTSKMISIIVTSFILAVVVMAITAFNAKIFSGFVNKAVISGKDSGNAETQQMPEIPQHSSFKEKLAAWKDSFFILGSFILGVVLSLYEAVPNSPHIKTLSMYTLYILIIIVGLSIGMDSKIFQTIKSFPKKMLALPFLTIISTFIGGAISFILLRWLSASEYVYGTSFLDSLGVSCGLGYYSLSSLMLNEIRGAEIGTIALAFNILRELMTIVLAPVLVKYFSPLAPISCGGATTSDSTLPAIQRACGNEYVPLSIFHGISVDTSVPFLITFISTLY